jgi:protein O-GlcNAc transferase
MQEAAGFFRAGDLARAELACRAVLRTEPRHTEALDILGLLAHQTGRHAEAAVYLKRAISTQPDAAILHLHLGLALRGLAGRDEEAIAAFGRAAALEPALPEAHHQRGNVLKRLGRCDEAVISLREAARLAPGEASVWLNLGVALLELSRREEAIACFRRAIALEPNRAEAHNILGVALLDHGETSAGLDALRLALQLRPGYAAACDNLARGLKAQGRLPEAIAGYRTALTAKPDSATHSNLLFALNFAPDLEPEQVFAEHAGWARCHAVPLRDSWRAHANEFAPERQLRVGFVSPDFVNHAVAYFFEPVLAQRDRQSWQAFCYSDATVPDRVTGRLRASSDQWREISPLRDEQVDALIRKDRIDVLVDLAGHTARNRLLVFARKPAPVQVTWLGYPNTTGLDCMDYRITDAVSDPAGATDAWYSEELFRMPRSFLCYQPPQESPAVNACPGARSGRVTFGSFSNFAKVSEPCLDVWMQLLQRVPGSRLRLKSRGLGDPETIARLRKRVQIRGVAPERVELDARLVSVADHLRLYHQIDIALDPFPYNGTTTTCEALWMGVPVVTLAGRSHVARVGASLLTHLGATEWIATSPDDYITRAAALAGDPVALAGIRAGLRPRLQNSPWCDAPGFARELTSALRAMWRRKCAGPPASPASSAKNPLG